MVRVLSFKLVRKCGCKYREVMVIFEINLENRNLFVGGSQSYHLLRVSSVEARLPAPGLCQQWALSEHNSFSLGELGQGLF